MVWYSSAIEAYASLKNERNQKITGGNIICYLLMLPALSRETYKDHFVRCLSVCVFGCHTLVVVVLHYQSYIGDLYSSSLCSVCGVHVQVLKVKFIISS